MAGMAEKQMRLNLEQVIQMMESAAPQFTVIVPAAEWPGIAWAVMQAEAGGNEREKVAEQLGVDVEDIENLISDMIQSTDPEVPLSVWKVGVVALKTATLTVQNTLATTWDQVEAMAIEKTVQAIQNLPGKSLDPTKMVLIAQMANKAVRRQGGESGGRPNAPAGQASPTDVAIEMQSGNVGSITLRFGARVLEQIKKPEKVIDVVANQPKRQEKHEMVKLKQIRSAIEQVDLQQEQDEATVIETMNRSAAEDFRRREDMRQDRREQFGFSLDDLGDSESGNE